MTDGNHHIVAISKPVPGAMHDKKLSDEVQTLGRLPEDCEVNADRGYQGLAGPVSWSTVRNPETGVEQQVSRITIHTPFKRPKGKELTESQQVFNRQLAAIRVRVEHIARVGKKLGYYGYPLSLFPFNLHFCYANGLWTCQRIDPTLAKTACLDMRHQPQLEIILSY